MRQGLCVPEWGQNDGRGGRRGRLGSQQEQTGLRAYPPVKPLQLPSPLQLQGCNRRYQVYPPVQPALLSLLHGEAVVRRQRDDMVA